MSDSLIFSAFTGAAAAFLFMRLVTWLDKLYERSRNHFLAIREVEYSCIQLISHIPDTRLALEIFVSAANKANNNPLPLIINRPGLLAFPVPNKFSLLNQFFLNEVYQHESLVERMNGDLRDFVDIHHQGQIATLENPALMDQQRFITATCKEAFEQLIPGLNDLYDRSMILGAQARVLAKYHRPIALRIMKLLSPVRRPRNYESKISTEIAQMKKEVSDSLQADIERCKKLKESQ